MCAYGVDVLDASVSTRRVHVLLENLPPWARLPGEQWSTEAELLAQLVDEVAALRFVTLRAAGAKNVTKPRPVRRPPRRQLAPAAAGPSPHLESAPGKASGWAEAAAMLAGMPGVQVVRRDA